MRVDVRVIAATNRDLPAEVDAGRFRADLYHRLNVYPLHVPPLRERPRRHRPAARLLPRQRARAPRPRAGARHRRGARRRCIAYDWPGNVRELEHTLLRASLRAAAGRRGEPVVIGREHLGIVGPAAPAAEAPSPMSPPPPHCATPPTSSNAAASSRRCAPPTAAGASPPAPSASTAPTSAASPGGWECATPHSGGRSTADYAERPARPAAGTKPSHHRKDVAAGFSPPPLARRPVVERPRGRASGGGLKPAATPRLVMRAAALPNRRGGPCGCCRSFPVRRHCASRWRRGPWSSCRRPPISRWSARWWTFPSAWWRWRWSPGSRTPRGATRTSAARQRRRRPTSRRRSPAEARRTTRRIARRSAPTLQIHRPVDMNSRAEPVRQAREGRMTAPRWGGVIAVAAAAMIVAATAGAAPAPGTILNADTWQQAEGHAAAGVPRPLQERPVAARGGRGAGGHALR